MKIPSSCGELGLGSMPNLTKVAFNSGDVSPAFTAAFTRLMIAVGVAAGAKLFYES